MAYTVSDLKNDLTGVLHGTTLNQVVGLDLLINRSARKVLSDCDPIEMVRIVPVTGPLFTGVFDYTCPDDLKGDRIIDIRPQIKRTVADRFFQTYNEPFDLTKLQLTGQAGEVTIQYNTAVKSLRIVKNVLQGLLVNTASTISDEGTWAVGGNATNLSVDTLNYVYGSGALRFDVIAGANPSTAYLENSTQTAVDLTRDWEEGSEFLYFYFPVASQVISCNLRWGSSPTDYWTQTVTTSQNSTAFQNGWNLLQFPWNGATIVGSPDKTSITYLRATVTYDGTVNYNYRLNDIVSQLGAIYEIEYYSKFMFRDSSTGVFQENVTDDSNIINLDTDSYNILFNQVAFLVAQQVQTSNSPYDASFFQKEYDESVARYVAKIKSQVLKPQSTYYEMPQTNINPLIRWSSQ